jgi:hypothetical protein
MEQKLRNFIANIQEQARGALHFTTSVYSEERNTTANIVFSSKPNPESKENTIWIDSKNLKANRYLNKSPVQIFYYGDLFAFFPQDAKKPKEELSKSQESLETQGVETLDTNTQGTQESADLDTGKDLTAETTKVEQVKTTISKDIEISHTQQEPKKTKKSNSSKRG